MERLTTVFRAALVAAATLAAPVMSMAQDLSRQVPVDADFGEGYINWPGLPGGYHFMAKFIAVDGRLELCGVGVFTDAYTRRQETEVLREAKFTMNGTPIIEDLTYFARVNRRRDLNGATANCRRTSAGVPQGEVSFALEVPSRRFRF